MQALTWIVATSLAANLVLAICFAHQRESVQRLAAAHAPVSPETSTQPSDDSGTENVRVPAWAQIGTVEPAEIAARLRAEGWAPNVVRVMVRAVMGGRAHRGGASRIRTTR